MPIAIGTGVSPVLLNTMNGVIASLEAILLETGAFLLLETGGLLLKE